MDKENMEKLFVAKSILQLCRAQLILHDKMREVFRESLAFALKTGCLKKRAMKAALDTTSILGHGAVRDPYNLLADGIVKPAKALASLSRSKAKDWAAAEGLWATRSPIHPLTRGSVRGEYSLGKRDLLVHPLSLPTWRFPFGAALYHTALILSLNAHAYWCILLMWGYRALTHIVGCPARIISALPCLVSDWMDRISIQYPQREGCMEGYLTKTPDWIFK